MWVGKEGRMSEWEKGIRRKNTCEGGEKGEGKRTMKRNVCREKNYELKDEQ